MYDQHIEIRDSNIGKGMFTKVQIPANVPIKEFRGTIYTLDEIWKPTDPPDAYSPYLQIGPNTFLGPTGSVDGADFINHSCNPNCFIHLIGSRAILYSLYVIPANAELTFDYSTTSTDTLDMWRMNCKCNHNRCRGVISGFQLLPKDIQDNYNQRGITPMFISRPNMIRKKIK
jgi:uncharacterized protein